MTTYRLEAEYLRRTIDPESLGFSDTSELAGKALPWIGQERAEKAARLGISIRHPDYNLFVLGEPGSGRSSLMKALLLEEAAKRPCAPDLCYLHNFPVPERPHHFWLETGGGKVLKDALADFVATLQREIPRELSGQPFKLSSDRILKKFRERESSAYRELVHFAESRNFSLKREDGRLVFTVLDGKGQAMLEEEVLSLSSEKRLELEKSEELLREEIQKFLDAMHPEERAMNEARESLRMDAARPIVEAAVESLHARALGKIHDREKFSRHVESMVESLMENLHLFEEDAEKEEREDWFSRCEVNLLLDHSGSCGAPVEVEDNPQIRTLFGSIDFAMENEVLVTDFTRIRAGSLIRANSGFLLLHLDDLLREPLVWEKLRRYLRSNLVHIEEPGMAYSSISSVSIEPEPVHLEVRIALIGSREEFYELEEIDPDFMRHFRVKVDFADTMKGTREMHLATSILIANVVAEHRLPQFSAAAVSRMLEDAHRRADDQEMQSARFFHLEMLVLESAEISRERGGGMVLPAHVEEALEARRARHSYPEDEMREAVGRGELLISVLGESVGQINGLTQIDLGDYRFGFPVRVSASTVPGRGGVLNIEREVALSGPNHDKGVFILESHLGALFSHIAPLNLDASLVFEQEYSGVEGDSASLAELYVLLSSLSGVPISRSIAVTGAMDLHGEVMPIGGVNEKIKGFFGICEMEGLDGSHGVIIPASNRRHLMLSPKISEAVAAGKFHVHAIEFALEGIPILTGMDAGILEGSGYRAGTVLGLAEQALLDYRRRYFAARRPSSP